MVDKKRQVLYKALASSFCLSVDPKSLGLGDGTLGLVQIKFTLESLRYGLKIPVGIVEMEKERLQKEAIEKASIYGVVDRDRRSSQSALPPIDVLASTMVDKTPEVESELKLKDTLWIMRSDEKSTALTG